MRSDKYWQSRMLRLKEAEIERINAEVRRLKKRYAEAESEFEDAIEKIYAKYADENGIIDVNIAKAFLTGKETDITIKLSLIHISEPTRRSV